MARRKSRPVAAVSGRQTTVNGVPVPPELYRPSDPVWQAHAAYVAYCQRHRWKPHVADRHGRFTSSVNRHRHSASQFAVRAGLTSHGLPDFHELRRLGLLG